MGAIDTLNFDLHSHSTASDGVLAPSALLQRAAANGVGALALTDHDELVGLAEAAEAAQACGVRLIPGVEISVTWGGMTIHVVGLGIDPHDATLAANLESVRASRVRRAERIAAELDAIGIDGSLEGAYAYAENPSVIGRTHFARFLVDYGVAADVAGVF